MTFIAEILLLFVNIIMAYEHAYMIERGKKIQHGWWGLGYVAFVISLALICKSYLLFVASLFIRKVFFDTALNYFRELPIFHVSTTTTSLIDKLHYKLFGKHSEIYTTIYFIVLLFTQLFL